MKNFLYLRGHPGVGKITIARILEKELGWTLFWFHDLKNAVYNIVREHRIPRLMDELTKPVITHLLTQGQSVIYVRPSPDKETIENIASVVSQFPDYKFQIVRLAASYDTLQKRALGRDDPYRINTKEALDQYINSRVVADIPGEFIIDTNNLDEKTTAQKIIQFLQNK